jgi:hypothetical protein
MRIRSCPQCRRRLPYAAQRCAVCGWLRNTGVASRRSVPWTRVGIGLATLVVLAFSAVWYSDRYLPALGDWYAGFAARSLPSSLSRLAPAETERGAFYFCARRIARQMDAEASIATFASEAESQTTRLGEGRFRVESFMEEATEDGERRRHDFACTVRYQRGQWVLEGLAMREPVGERVLVATLPDSQE